MTTLQRMLQKLSLRLAVSQQTSLLAVIHSQWLVLQSEKYRMPKQATVV